MKIMKRMLALACVLCLMLSLAGCGKLQIEREIGTVNGNLLSQAEFSYYLENVKAQMISEAQATDEEAFWDADIDGVKASDAAKNKALEEMLRVEIACIKAAEKGLAVSGDVKNNIKATVNAQSGDQKTQIDALLSLTGMNRNELISVMEKTALASTLASSINTEDASLLTPSAEEIKAAYEKDYVHVKHVLVMNTDASVDTSDMTPEEIAAQADASKVVKKAIAEEVLTKAKAGADFDTLVKEYGEDPGMEQSPDGYTFTKGTMVAEFESASYALAVGEVSDLVESSYGWHIIKKYALPTSGTDYDNAVQAVTSSLSQEKYNALLDSYKSDMTIEIRQNIVDGIKVK